MSAYPAAIAVVVDTVKLHRLKAALGDRVSFCSSTEIIPALARTMADVVVLESGNVVSSSNDAIVTRIKILNSGIRVAVYTELTTASLRAMLSLGRAGANLVIVRDHDDDPTTLRRLLSVRLVDEAIGDVLELAARALHQDLIPVAREILLRLPEAVSAGDIAHDFGVVRRTLSKRASKHGVHGIRSLATRLKVACAIAAFSRGFRLTEELAHRVGFSSAGHLRQAIRRETGLVASDARLLGGTSSWFSRLFTTNESVEVDPRASYPGFAQPTAI